MLCALYRDVASAYPALKKSTQELELKLIRQRFNSEGVAFLTKTLPRFAKAVDMALATDTPLNVSTFERRRGACLPKFLGWLTECIFDDSGMERGDSCSIALKHLRQILYLFYKLEMPYSESDVSRVIEEFKATDAGFCQALQISDPRHKYEIKYAASLIKRVLGGVDPRGITPKNGPGSVATGEQPEEKPYFKREYRQATSVYPISEYYYFNGAHMSDCLNEYGLNTRTSSGELRPWEVLDVSTAKVVLVPKDSRGPRLISMEPLEIQWLQQGQNALIVKSIEASWLTSGHVNFQEQGINRYLAWTSTMEGVIRDPNKRGSRLYKSDYEIMARSYNKGMGLDPHVDYTDEDVQSRKAWHNADLPGLEVVPTPLVSADMKEASDRVTVWHVTALFPLNWVEALLATRSDRTILPDGEVVNLNKFAPMGSAVCFPVEALVFWALAIASIRCSHPRFASRNDGKSLLAELRKRVWVYGDDLILYAEDYSIVKQSLERTGILLNANKCCTAQFFRESCGLDAHKGIIVTPLRIKECVGSHWTGQSLMSYVSYSNEAYRRGYYELASELEKLISDQVKIPFTTEDRGLIQFVRPAANVKALNKQHGVRVRFNRDLHYLEAYGPTPRAATTTGHQITWESYLERSMSKYKESGAAPPNVTDTFAAYKAARSAPVGVLKADQYPIPRRVTSNRGWKQISL
jgi:hypothetical protein